MEKPLETASDWGGQGSRGVLGGQTPQSSPTKWGDVKKLCGAGRGLGRDE